MAADCTYKNSFSDNKETAELFLSTAANHEKEKNV